MRKLAMILFIFAMPIALASCQTGMGNVEFASNQRPNGYQISMAKKAGKKLDFKAKRISGIFAKPDGKGPFPAMVLVHGCAGIRSNISMWGRWFKEKGYVTLAPDSFGPRGFSEICTDFKRVPQWERFEDVYGAANYLATLPYVDKASIGIMGFSNGAGTALDAVEEAKLPLLGDSDQRFALSIPLYPECRWRTGPWYVPVMILIGEKDDWTLAESCKQREKSAVNHSQPFSVKVYEDARHAFDRSGGILFLPDVKNFHSSTGYGATIGSSGKATEAAKRDIEVFLNRYMRKAAGS